MVTSQMEEKNGDECSDMGEDLFFHNAWLKLTDGMLSELPAQRFFSKCEVFSCVWLQNVKSNITVLGRLICNFHFATLRFYVKSN